mgnify:CR=1 FL=1
MPDDASLCRNFIQLRDTMRAKADEIQGLIDKLIASLEGLLSGPYLDILRTGLAAARTDADRLAAVQTAHARLQRNLQKLMKAVGGAAGAGAPVETCPAGSLRLSARPPALLRALSALRDRERAFDGHVKDWCN